MPNEARRTKKLTQVLSIIVLGIDSNYEPVTRAAYEYREAKVYPHIQAKGFGITKLQGPMARRFYVAPEAKKPEVEYITGVGHGSYNLYTGDLGDVVFQVGNYQLAEANGKIVHLLSCQTARDLGPDFVRNGARAYFGYDENFTFTMAEKDVFFECDSEIDRAFVDGLNATQVYDRTKLLFEQRIASFRAAGKVDEAGILEFDLKHLRCPTSPSPGGERWGDPKAKLS